MKNDSYTKALLTINGACNLGYRHEPVDCTDESGSGSCQSGGSRSGYPRNARSNS
jgi:hypothetical protein